MNSLVFDLIKTATANAIAKDPAHAVPEYQYVYSKELIDLVVNDCISIIEALEIELAIDELKRRYSIKIENAIDELKRRYAL